MKDNIFAITGERQMQRFIDNVKKRGGEMKEKSILAITLTCLSLFGFRSILPEISSAAVEKFNAVYVYFANSDLVASAVDTIMFFVS